MSSTYPPPSRPCTLDDVRTGTGVAEIRASLLEHLFYTMGRFPEIATENDLYMALAYPCGTQRWRCRS